jgi:nicotinamidase-related amidase
VEEVLIVGFLAHLCVSTTAREALMRGLQVRVDAAGAGAFPLQHKLLGEQSAAEVHRTAVLHLSHLGVTIAASETADSGSAE